jgi:CRISPR/Cas system CSM-associated protein Csm3 (group 7 of RAMP superfamily)
MSLLALDIRLTLETPLHTTGNRRLWGVDRACAVSSDDKYVIPATSLKGYLRANAEVLFSSWGLPVCLAPSPTMCLDPQNPCLVCRVFGNPRRMAPLKFSEARPLDEVSSLVRSGVSISRYRRTALPQRLFFIETVQSPSTTEWGAKATGSFESQRAAKEAAALISLATRMQRAIGGGRGRGLGWIRSWSIRVKLDNQPLSDNDFQPIWQEWSGGEAA